MVEKSSRLIVLSQKSIRSGSPQGDVTIYLQEEPMNEENCVGNTVPRGAARIEIL